MARTTKQKPQIVIVLGTGSAPTSVITTGVEDALAGNVQEIALAWHGKDAAITDVFSMLSERETCPVFTYTDSAKSLPKSVSELSEDIVESDDLYTDILVDSFDRAIELGAEVVVLLLWDDADEKSMEKVVYKAHGGGARVLDVANGLVPIEVEEEETPLKEVDTPLSVEEDEEDVETEEPAVIQEEKPFTLPELEAMPLAAIKRMVKSQGHTVPMHANKRHLIDMLIGDGAEPTVADVQEMLAPVKEEVATPIKGVAFAVVLYTNGQTVTVHLNDKNRKAIADLLI